MRANMKCVILNVNVITVMHVYPAAVLVFNSVGVIVK